MYHRLLQGESSGMKIVLTKSVKQTLELAGIDEKYLVGLMFELKFGG